MTQDQHGQLVARADLNATGSWRTNHGTENIGGIYVLLELEQIGPSVTGKFDITSTHSGTLIGTMTGTHLTGVIADNSGDPPESFEFVFSADIRRFVGHYGTTGVWNGAH